MDARTLRLRQEALADLTTDELGAVAGASGTTVYCDTMVTYTVVLTGCMCTAYVETLNAPCDSRRICVPVP